MKSIHKLVIASSVLVFSLLPLATFASEVTGTLSTDPNQTMINNQGNPIQMDMPNQNDTTADVSDSASQVDREFLLKFGIILVFTVIVIAFGINTFSPRSVSRQNNQAQSTQTVK